MAKTLRIYLFKMNCFSFNCSYICEDWNAKLIIQKQNVSFVFIINQKNLVGSCYQLLATFRTFVECFGVFHNIYNMANNTIVNKGFPVSLMHDCIVCHGVICLKPLKLSVSKMDVCAKCENKIDPDCSMSSGNVCTREKKVPLTLEATKYLKRIHSHQIIKCPKVFI